MPPHGPMRAPAKPKHAKDTFKRLLDLMKEYKVRLLLVVLCIIATTGISSLTTYMLQPVYATIGQLAEEYALTGVAPALNGLITLLSTMAILYLVSVSCTYFQNRTMMMVSTSVLNRVRKKMFDHMEDLPIRYFDQRTHGEIMSRYTNDTDTLREFFSSTFPQAVNSLLSICFALFFMLRLSGWLTLLVILLMPLMMMITKTIGARSGKNFVAQQKAVGALNGYIEETIEGQRVVQVFCHEEKAMEEFEKRNEAVRIAGTRAHTFASLLGPIMNNLSHCNYVLVTLVGVIMIIVGKNNPESIFALEIATLLAFLPMIRQFSQPISNLAQQFNTVMLALAGAERVFELMDEPVETDEGYVTLVNAKKDEKGNIVETKERTGMWAWKHPHKADGTVTYTELKGDVVFEDVTFGYVPEKTVLHNISLYAKPGQKIAFVGSTGAGKTTITNLINRFYDIQGGKIRYDGINIQKIKKDDLRRSLAMVLQDTHLFTGTVRDNIRYGKLDATDEEIERAAKIANADFFIRHLPQGYDTMLTGDGANLSQGQRQLLAIARAAVADPPVLILDEATSSIDTRTELLIERGMDALMHGRTVFVIAHRLSTVRNSQAIMVLENGHIIERGDHDSLIAQQGKYYQLYTGMFELS
ncbi:MAG: ABC transporter ATP-binding protein [Clostridiales bacterium]|nr:ABC transporter ATP-binding protein [Clostridiales bacterium]